MTASGEWQVTTWAETLVRVRQLARRLRNAGICHGERVAVVLGLSPAWEWVQLAVLSQGGVVVGIDLSEARGNLARMVEVAGITAVVAQTEAHAEPVSASAGAALRWMLVLQKSSVPESWEFLDADRDAETTMELPRVAAWDIATVVFTSGTSGTPKGIAYTHGQLSEAVSAISKTFPEVRCRDRLVCWMPMSNLFQRMVNLLGLYVGASVYFVAQPSSLLDSLSVIQPCVLVAVPRFYEKLYAGIMQKVAELPRLQCAMILMALRVGDKWAEAVRNGSKPKLSIRFLYPLCDAAVLRRLRAPLGTALRYLVSGSAPMPPDLLKRLHAMGLLVLEAYGLTENVIPIAANRFYDYRLGTVGKALPGNELQIAADGELLVRGPGVFSGYLGFGNGDGGFTAEGFYRTGDFATIDNAGFITLLGRKSDIIKTSTGRRISPWEIEGRLEGVEEIERPVVLGASQKHLIVVATRVQPASMTFCDETKLEACLTVLAARIRDRVASLPPYKRPLGMLLLSEPFSVAGGELTANLKLRRHVVSGKYQDEIAALYAFVESEAGERDPVAYLVLGRQVLLRL